jgi:hypothetical protein
MAFQFVSRHVFNEHLYKWVSTYNKLIKSWNDNPQRSETDKISPEIRCHPIKLEGQLEKLIGKENRINKGESTTPEHETRLTEISQMFLQSFKDFTPAELDELNSQNPELPPVTTTPFKQLKEKDRGLLTNRFCIFLRHLQIVSVWNKIWSKQDKQEFWKWLNGTYLLVQVFHVIPAKTLENLQMIVRELHQSMVVEKKSFNKVKFTQDCELVIQDLKIDQVNNMSNFFWQFVVSEDTPISSLVPPEHRGMIEKAIQFLKNSDGQQILMDRMSPFVSEFKNRLSGTGIEIDTETGQINVNDNARTGKEMVMMTEEEKYQMEEKEKASKRHLLHSIIDMVASIIEKHKGIVKQLIDDPQNALQVIKTEFGPMIMDMVTQAALRGMGLNKTEDELKQEKINNENKYLPGVQQLKRRNKK